MARNLKGRLVNHAEIARELTARPYEWGTVSIYSAAYVAAQMAHDIRTASRTCSVYGPVGSFETRATPVEDGTLLEARYVLGIARALPGLIQGSPDTVRVLGQIERREIRCGREAAREIAAHHEEQYGDAWTRPAPTPTTADLIWADALTVLSPPTGPNGTPVTERTLPHDPYITAVCDALTAADIELTDQCWTDDGETRGTYCYLNTVITLDPSKTDDLDHDDIPADAAWPHGLLLIWEWHSGREADQGEPDRGPVWLFAELKDDGSNEFPTVLPVYGYASPAAVVEAARKVISREIGAGSFYGSGLAKWDGGIIGGSWEHADELESAATAWDAQE